MIMIILPQILSDCKLKTNVRKHKTTGNYSLSFVMRYTLTDPARVLIFTRI